MSGLNITHRPPVEGAIDMYYVYTMCKQWQLGGKVRNKRSLCVPGYLCWFLPRVINHNKLYTNKMQPVTLFEMGGTWA